MALVMAAALAGSSLAAAAEGPADGGQQEQRDGQRGSRQEQQDGQQGGGQHDEADASGHSGPPVSDETVDLEAVQTFAFRDMTLTLEDAAGTAFILTKSGEKEQINGAAAIDTPTNGSMRGMRTITQMTVESVDDETLLAEWMPVAWSDNQILVLKQDGTFSPALDMDKAVTDYTFENVENSESATGYSTTISVEDPDEAYETVWAYGMWMASAAGDTEAAAYEPEDWENGMYYSGYGYRPMEYSDGVWSLTLDLASADMRVQCFHDVDESAFEEEIQVPDGSTVTIPYDAEKQSESFDWSVTADNEKAGAVTSVTIGDGIKLAVYTPYGYDAEDAGINYPVLYLIPGMQTDYNTWFTGGKADKIFDNLIAEGKTAPTILVTMTRDTAKMDYNDVWDSADERSKSNGDGDGYINYEEGFESGSGTEHMIQSLLVTEVIPYIDGTYHTAADAAHRAVIGTSMGGVAATQIWMTSNDIFDYYGFFSGADLWFKADDDAKAAEEYRALRPVYEADYTSLLDAAAANGKKILVGGGITDRNAFGGDQNSAGADNVSAWLTEHQVDHEYLIVGGGHDWTSWTQLLMKFTEFLSSDSSGWQL